MTSGFPEVPDDATAPVGFARHDHATCVLDGLSAAEARCTGEGLRFTPVRRKVLEILLQEHRALGAYAILDRLRDEGFGSQPPVAYRALDFLRGEWPRPQDRAAERLHRLRPSRRTHAPAFMICRVCESVAEAQSAPARGALGAAARATGFRSNAPWSKPKASAPPVQKRPTHEPVVVENLSVSYGARTALSHVSLGIEPGEIVTIVGPNGSGQDQPSARHHRRGETCARAGDATSAICVSDMCRNGCTSTRPCR